MSAFMCSDATFDAIASYATTHRVTFRATNKTERAFWDTFDMANSIDAIGYRQEIAKVLYHENVRSLQARYPSSPDMWDDGYVPRAVARELSHAQVLGAIRCYTYQSCETSDFEDSLAFLLVETIKDHAVRELSDKNVWDVKEELVRPVGQPVPISLFEMASSYKRPNGAK